MAGSPGVVFSAEVARTQALAGLQQKSAARRIQGLARRWGVTEKAAETQQVKATFNGLDIKVSSLEESKQGGTGSLQLGGSSGIDHGKAMVHINTLLTRLGIEPAITHDNQDAFLEALTGAGGVALETPLTGEDIVSAA